MMRRSHLSGLLRRDGTFDVVIIIDSDESELPCFDLLEEAAYVKGKDV